MLQHEGLGRYEDPLDPFGDVRAMAELWSITKPGGLLFLSVPVANDCLVFNVHRVYGRRRLPLLLAGWKVIDAIGIEQHMWEDGSCPADQLPILVLQRPRSSVGNGEGGAIALLPPRGSGLEKIHGLAGPYPLYSKGKHGG